MAEVEKRAFYDASERAFTFLQVQDVEPILDRNKELRSIEQTGDWGRHVATIPNVVLMQWLNEEYERGNVGLRMYSAEFDQLVARKLQDSDFRNFRTDR